MHYTAAFSLLYSENQSSFLWPKKYYMNINENTRPIYKYKYKVSYMSQISSFIYIHNCTTTTSFRWLAAKQIIFARLS